ncbi:MAG TPA: DUF4440 domain-containing protein [Steroidobacteraceae bacterium]|nr:DUF4440 domain-containing protein [Steroidobacteraceae bacterium]
MKLSSAPRSTPSSTPRSTLCSLLGLALLSGCSTPVVSPGMPPELKHSWEVSFNRGDSAAVAALYSDNAELVMSNAAPVTGKTAIRAEIDRMIQSGAKVRIGAAQNVGSGDLAYVYGPYSVAGQNGQVIEAGTYVEVWRRRGGVWRIDLDVNSVGAPP